MESYVRECILDNIRDLPEYSSTPFFVCNLRRVTETYSRWQKCLPSVQPYYAVKTNHDVGLLAHLASLGSNFDCASVNEMRKILDLGVSPDRIILASPVKSPESLIFARNNDVKLMTFDNFDELVKVRKLCPQAQLVLRIQADGEGAIVNLNDKFGAEIEDAKRLIAAAKVMGLECVGVCFHVGSGVDKSSPYFEAISDAKTLFNVAQSIGAPMKLLDVGGGFVPESFDKVAYDMSTSLTQHFPAKSGVELCAEPGRFFARDAFIVVCNVLGLRKTFGGSGKTQLYQSDGVWQSFSCAVYEKTIYRPDYVVRNYGGQWDMIPISPGPHEYTIWGPSCDSLDLVAQSFNSKIEIESGDWLVYGGLGAYTLSCASDFNGIERPQVVEYLQ